jgi:Na+/proline symporter
MDTYAASFLIPIAVVGYTAFGGLKGTYYASYTHTFIIYVALVVFMWKVYTGPSDIGTADKMYDHLPCAAERVRGIKDYPTGTNSKGTFLTFRSGGALIFGIANVVGNFGTVFADQSYWQGAIACKASATWKGYLLGGWHGLPFPSAWPQHSASQGERLTFPSPSRRRGTASSPLPSLLTSWARAAPSSSPSSSSWL